jgi:putative hemolysin
VAAGPGGLVDIATAVLLTAVGSLFAAGDAALNEIPDGRMIALAAEPARATFRRYSADPTRVLSRWLVGRTITIAVAAVLLYGAAQSLGELALPISILGAVLLYGLFTQVVVTLARRRPEQVGAWALVFLRPLEWILIPVADPLSFLGRAVRRRVPRVQTTDARIHETEVEWVVNEGEKAGAMEKGPAQLIRNVLDFKNLTAREVMVPRRKMQGIDVLTPLDQVFKLVSAEKHSRYPVYRGNLDNIIGQLYAKDLFAVVRDGRIEGKKLSELMRSSVMFVSENEPAAKILQDMRSRRLHMAIVSDEFGGTAGLVTLEDVLEEIVGDIRDENDQDVPIQTMGDGRVVVDASVSISEVETALGKPLGSDGEFESLGGLVVSRAGRVPKVGATVRLDGMNLIVREADEKRVVKVEIVPDHGRTAPAT